MCKMDFDRGSIKNKLLLACQDVMGGLLKFQGWRQLAKNDVKITYYGSFIGVWWISLGMALTIYVISALYAVLFHVNSESYYPYLIAGIIVWRFISGLLSELSNAFSKAAIYTEFMKLPYSLHIYRVIWRNLLVFSYNLVIMIPVLIIYHHVINISFNMVLFIPALLLVCFNGFTYGSIFAMLGARYNDIQLVILNLLNIAFFVTPVLWLPSAMGKYASLNYFNPLYCFLDILRSPLIGTVPNVHSVVVIGVLSLIGAVLFILFFSNYRSQIVYWAS